jgi:multiple sugar transport system substrate-binding protein
VIGKILAAIAVLGVLGCGEVGGGDEQVRLQLWGLGREGEVVRELIPEFERRHPGIKVDVQQIPWTAAHEKLLTAFVGDAAPDIAQIGNTWVPELAELEALAELPAEMVRDPGFAAGDFFPGALESNRVEGRLWGLPWYVDTRVVFYRKDLLAAAGAEEFPRTWSAWRALMERLRGPGRYAALLPTDEWEQPVILALQTGAPLIRDGRRAAFDEPGFRRALAFYLDIFRDGLAPPANNNQISSVYQQFAAGEFAMYLTGPWNLGEFARRLPPEMAEAWDTAPMPAPDGMPWPGASLAGGSNLVVMRGSRQPREAWMLARYLVEPASQMRLYELCGDLPSRRSVWQQNKLATEPRLDAFYVQMQAARPTPALPEWQRVATAIGERADAAIRGAATLDLTIAALDREVDVMLDKRRFLLARREAERMEAEGRR